MHYNKASTNSYDADLRAILSFHTLSYDIAQAGTAFQDLPASADSVFGL